jgi:hypothetical protein
MENKNLAGWHKQGDIEAMAEIGVFEAGDVIHGINPLQSRDVPGANGKSVSEYCVTEEALRNLCPRAYARIY